MRMPEINDFPQIVASEEKTIIIIMCVCVCVCGDYLAHTDSTLYARISPQWLSELRRLWPSVS